MRIHRRVFVFALSAGMVVGVIRGYGMFLPLLLIERYGLSSSQCGLCLSILSVVLDILIPLILFVALYRLGKRIDLRSTYVDVSVSLFIGCALAYGFGYVVGSIINPMSREMIWADWTSILEMAAMHGLSHGLYLFFLGFTAIALAYFRSREGLAE
jgi:hypothetical protein